MKVKHLLLLFSRHRITVTLSGVLIITVISSLVFVQNVFGQNPLIQMYDTIQTITAASSAGTGEVPATVPADDKSLQEAMKEITPPETLAALTPEPAALITGTPITAVPVTSQEATLASSAAVVTEETKEQTYVIQETEPETAVAEAAAQTLAAAPAPAAEAPAAEAPAPEAPAPEAPAGSYDSAMASSVLDVVNRVRSDNGLPALVWNDSLASSAQIRAQEIVVCWEKDHSRPDGSEWWTAGDQLQMAENLGKLQSSAEGVVGDWMASSTHAANILNGSYTNMGAACYYCGGIYYWAQEFY